MYNISNLKDYVGKIYECRLNKGQLLDTFVIQRIIKSDNNNKFKDLMQTYNNFFLCEFELNDLIVSGITPYKAFPYVSIGYYNDLEDRYSFTKDEKLYYSNVFIHIDDIITFTDNGENKVTFLIKDLVILDE